MVVSMVYGYEQFSPLFSSLGDLQSCWVSSSSMYFSGCQTQIHHLPK